MAEQIWFLRHGDAEPHGTREDADRRLTERGEQQSRVAGQALEAIGVVFDAAYTSPRVRAHDTMRIACEPLGLDFLIHEPLSEGFGAKDALDLLGQMKHGAHVLLVGHEPDFSSTVAELTGARIDIKKGGVAAVRLKGGGAELFDLLRPRELEAIAGLGEPA